MTSYYFIENLTFIAWLLYIFPVLISGRSSKKNRGDKLFFISGSKSGIRLAHFMSFLVGMQPERLDFRLVDIRDDSGCLIRLRIAYQDLAEVQDRIVQNPEFQGIVAGDKHTNLPVFLTKSLGTAGPLNSSDRTIWRALYVIQVCLWISKRDGVDPAQVLLFMARRPWLKEIERYAAGYRIRIAEVGHEFLVPRPKELMLRVLSVLPPRLATGFRAAVNRWFFARNVKREKEDPAASRGVRRLPAPSGPKLAVEYYGHLDLKTPALKSDLFFWQQSEMNGGDIVVTFSIPSDPLDEKKWTEISDEGMSAVVLDARATTVPYAPVFYHFAGERRILSGRRLKGLPSTVETRFLRQQLSRYDSLYEYWRDFFESYNVRLFTSWYRYDGTHCVMADAIRDLGGISTLYQRAFEEFPSPETGVTADVFFGFSRQGVGYEQLQRSVIPYYVITGYNGDHRVPLLRQEAGAVRDRLRSHGARHIIAFFDENSTDDSRWHTGHEFMRVNYRFLLEKVLAEPTFGVVFKPKVPFTLRRRLGEVADLLAAAESTGRCFVWQGGALQGPHPPMTAALAADIAVHGHVCAATAGIEAALAGVPTLLMDREGWPVSGLYELGKGRVVFTEWEDLWAACREHWRVPGGVPGLGDWSQMLDYLDPFRDGRAAQRMGDYLTWLLDDLKAGRGRETALVNAAERYRRAWGADKVVDITAQTVPDRQAAPS